MNVPALLKQLEEHEDYVPHAYPDSLGYLTIGIGRLVDKRLGGGITREEADFLLANDVARFRSELDSALPWWTSLDEVRQRVVLDMIFTLGLTKLLRFRNTLAAVKRGDWEAAARGILASKYATQVGRRARRLAAMMRTGKDVALEDV